MNGMFVACHWNLSVTNLIVGRVVSSFRNWLDKLGRKGRKSLQYGELLLSLPAHRVSSRTQLWRKAGGATAVTVTPPSHTQCRLLRCNLPSLSFLIMEKIEHETQATWHNPDMRSIMTSIHSLPWLFPKLDLVSLKSIRGLNKPWSEILNVMLSIITCRGLWQCSAFCITEDGLPWLHRVVVVSPSQSPPDCCSVQMWDRLELSQRDQWDQRPEWQFWERQAWTPDMNNLPVAVSGVSGHWSNTG